MQNDPVGLQDLEGHPQSESSVRVYFDGALFEKLGGTGVGIIAKSSAGEHSGS